MTTAEDLEADDDPGYPAVIAIDPGGVTGWALLQVHPDCLADPETPILDNITFRAHGQYENMTEIQQSAAIADLADAWDSAAFVIEDFILREMSMGRELLSPVRITAHLEWHFTQDYEPTRRMFKQQPAEALATATDIRLKRWGLYDRHSGVHARDATRHAVMFLRKAKSDERVRRIAWPHIYGAQTLAI